MNKPLDDAHAEIQRLNDEISNLHVQLGDLQSDMRMLIKSIPTEYLPMKYRQMYAQKTAAAVANRRKQNPLFKRT